MTLTKVYQHDYTHRGFSYIVRAQLLIKWHMAYTYIIAFWAPIRTAANLYSCVYYM